MAAFSATAYGPPWGGIQGTGVTASGVDLRRGQPAYIVAVDPQVIPLGSKLRISPNPFGDPRIVFTAADTGGAIKGNRIDFYDWRGRQAQQSWGRRDVQVSIVSNTGSSPGAGIAAAYPALRIDPGVDVAHVSPTLLRRLNDVAARAGKQVEVFSGYRTSAQSAASGGFAGDPHTRGLAVDANIDGRPIAEVIGPSVLSAAGLRSGADPALQPFYRGGPDPAHVDLMNPQGTGPMSGLGFYPGLGASATGPFPVAQSSGGGVWDTIKGVLTWQANVPGIGDPLDPLGVGKKAESVVSSTISVGEFLGKLTDPRFWLRVLEIVGGSMLILVGLLIVARSFGVSTPGGRPPGVRRSTWRNYGSTTAPSRKQLRDAELERQAMEDDEIPF